MKSTDQIFEDVKKRLLNENFLGIAGTPAINTWETAPKASYETKFLQYLAEESKKAKEDESIKAVAKKQSNYVDEVNEHGYDQKDKDKIDNLNGQEFLVGIYCECINNPKLSLDEAKKIVTKNLAKNELYYVEEGQFGVKGLGYKEDWPGLGPTKAVKGKYASSGMEIVKEVRSKVRSLLKEHSMYLGVGTGQQTFKGAEQTPGLQQIMFPGSPSAIDEEMTDPVDRIGDEERGADDEFHPESHSEESTEQMRSPDKPMAKKTKNKPIKLEQKLKEIEKASTLIAMEARIAAIEEEISSRSGKLDEVEANEAIAEFVNPAKVKSIQREIKLLEKQIKKFKRVYERQAGKEYISEMPATAWEKGNGMSVDYAPRKVGKDSYE